MVIETQNIRRSEDDRLTDKFVTSLTERRRRAEVRQQVQSEDLDLSPTEVTRLTQQVLAASLGGQARAKSLTPARRRAIAKGAARARWGKR